MLENKLGITNFLDLAHEEERITKLKALELFDFFFNKFSMNHHFITIIITS